MAQGKQRPRLRYCRNTTESSQLADKITEGVKLAIRRLIEKTRKEDGDIVISKDGKVVKMKARDLKEY